jgi:N-acetylmuramoyl-L-alanine amidase
MKFCIDAGHNNDSWDTGATGNGLREQDLTFAFGHKLAEVLRNYDFEVIETRPTKETNLGTDLNSSLQKRCDIANNAGVDYFISIHCNAYNASANGTETLIYAKDGEAEKLANEVNQSLVDNIGTTNRGVKVQNVKVLRSTTMPAILVETAFITNVNDADILVNRQDDIANGIVKGICKYLKIDYKEGENNMSQDHWAKAQLDELVNAGVISNPELWSDFEASVSTKTIGELLALINKVRKA